MQPLKPGGPRGQLCGGWTWVGDSWLPSDLWGKLAKIFAEFDDTNR